MPGRGASDGYDLTPILTHYLFLFTSILSIAGWFTAFIGQAAATARDGNGSVGVLWFAIFLELALILGVLHTVATDSIGLHRFQIATFGAVAVVFAVIGVNQGIYSHSPPLQAMAAGWLILSIVNILWVLYFTSEEDSLALHLFNSLGTGGLSSPSRRRRNVRSSVAGIPNSGYPGGYTVPGAQGGSYGVVGAQKDEMASSQGIGGGPTGGTMGAMGTPQGQSPRTQLPPMTTTASEATPGAGARPLSDQTTGETETFQYRAKALYAYTASPDDPNEISFSKGEVLDIVDNSGKWWQARRADGTRGIAPSNYLQII